MQNAIYIILDWWSLSWYFLISQLIYHFINSRNLKSTPALKSIPKLPSIKKMFIEYNSFQEIPVLTIAS